MKKYLRTPVNLLILQQVPFKAFIALTGARVVIGPLSVKFLYQDYVLLISLQAEDKADPQSGRYDVTLYRKLKAGPKYRQVRKKEGGKLLDLPNMMSKVSGLMVEHYL